ncbi:Phosphatidylinositol 4-phosphate 5-kinase 5 [Apostasia shenzhenica]|uniref:Phosphatidylinositol 4-phosphate 5-kinase 5 n=1 Tax=Apostasia shenzhenica TaxID=1088818 RepID=A0A2I0BEX5_9ASPA|nr:Phosphatidylinositol 4-phosphate 5-kinase 5 [Apostasia shenzhenica]
MHLKKSEAQIGEESFGFSADYSPPPLLQIHISNPNPSHGFALQTSPPAALYGILPASTPHKRPVMTQPAASAAAGGNRPCHALSSIRPPNSPPGRVFLRLPFSSATRSAVRHALRRLHLRVRLLLLLSFPLYFILVSSSTPSASFSRSYLLDFLYAIAFSSAIFFILSFSIFLFPLSSIRLLLSRSSSLIPRHQRLSPRPVQWSIGSAAEKPKSVSSTTSGFSVQIYSNGDVYEGEFHKGKCSGSGVYYYYMSGRYEGDWVDSKYDGYGVETWARGSRYRGQYRQGLRHGIGVYRFYTGDVYAGEWSNGQSHGYGVHTCEDGSRYVGEFKWGVKHGLGRYHFRNGDTYAGEYFADKMHGFGIYRFANGHQYEGAWHEGRRQGLGMYTFRNGDTQAGHWQNGILDVFSTENALPGSPIAADHSKVLNAVQEARRAAERTFDSPRIDDRVNKTIAAANKAANAGRVAAVKAVQKQIPNNGDELPIPFV